MSISKYFIDRDWQEQKALALHEVALLDFLNAVQSPGELNNAIIQDDPNRFDDRRGYGIGKKVAERIIEKRDRLGKFTSLKQLDDIKGFGDDKFHDLVYTFVELRIPLPSGKGRKFDDFIKAVGALENAFTGSTKKFVSALRKLFFNPTIGIDGDYNLNWDEILPSSSGNIPSSWTITDELKEAVLFIVNHPEISIDNIPVNTYTLIAGLDAQNFQQAIQPLAGQLSFSSNEKYGTYLNPLSLVQYFYLDSNNLNLQSTSDQLLEDKLNEAFLKIMTFGQYYASADAYAIPFDENRALVWNLLNYYTEDDSPITENRFTNFIQATGLGSFSQGRFSNHANAYRVIQKDILHAYLNLSQQNGRNPIELSSSLNEVASSSEFTGLTAISSFVTDLFIDILAFLVASQKEKPTALTWNRLEGRPRTQDFIRPLFAEIRDPLWMLCRQYQMGEFKGEDAGSAIETRVKIKTSRIDQLATANGDISKYNNSVPLEMLVEQQNPTINLLTKMDMSQKWVDMLRQGGESETSNNLLLGFLQNNFPFQSSPDSEDYILQSDAETLATLSLLSQSNQFDGYAFYKEIASGKTIKQLSGIETPVYQQLADSFINWANTTLFPNGEHQNSSWNPSHLEYQFACSAPKSNVASTLLVADEYASGSLDWYNFDFMPNTGPFPSSLIPLNPSVALIEEEVLTVIPTLLSYPGMPLPRWWQMEDYTVNFDQLNIDKSDSASLAFAEFVTLYSNDWMIIPFQIQAGSISDIKSLIVKDVFGLYTSVKPAGKNDATDWQRWAMFDLNQRSNNGIADHRLFTPPTLVRGQESDAVEKVNFLRDEMANMVWAIEMVVPNEFAGGTDGFESALKLRRFIDKKFEQQQSNTPNRVENDAKISYQLGSEVPENWIPFIPVKGDGNSGNSKRMIQLQRAAMPRIIPGQPTKRIRPRTSLLRVNHTPDEAQEWHPYFVFEEEVPRSGSIVTKTWQRTRWYNGKTLVWLGNRKQNGRGQANSGLAFDSIVDKEKP